VFTARYALSPYIKQIRFVFKGLIKLHYNLVRKLRTDRDVTLYIQGFRQEDHTFIKPMMVCVKSVQRNKIPFSTLPPSSPISTEIMRIGCYTEDRLLIFIERHYESMGPVASDIIK
jgi:hypothetical protein